MKKVMLGLTIRSIECNYFDGDETTRDPSWIEIEKAIRSLEKRSGRIDIWVDNEDVTAIMVAGSPGVYAVDVLIDEDNAAMLVCRCKSPDAFVEVDGEDYHKDQVVFDLDIVVTIVKHFVDTREYLATDDLEWEFRNM